ncbi:MAG: pentapeptide repeat-containing protein [Verrucomicrobiia bacterium]
MNDSIFAVYGLGGAELLIVLVLLLLAGAMVLGGVGLVVALAIRFSNRKSSAQPLANPQPGPPPVESEEPVKEHANLAGTRFHNANLTGADFDDVNLSNARFHNVNLSNAVISAAQMGGASFKHIGPPLDSEGVQTRQRPVRFEEMMLCDSTFRKVDLSNVRITDCDLTGATIEGIPVTDMLASYKSQRNRGPEGDSPAGSPGL